MSNRTKGILSIVASAFGFAVMALCVGACDRWGAPISGFQKSFFRNLIALIIALAVFVRHPRVSAAAFGWREGTALLLRSALGTCGIFANFHALSVIPIAEGQTLNKTAPFFTVLFAWLLLGEKATRRQLLALAIAFGGVLLIAKPGFAGAAGVPLLIGLSSGACAGSAYACLRVLRRRQVDSSFIVLFFSAFSCLASVPFMCFGFVPMTRMQTLILSGAGAGAALGQFGITLAYGFAAPREISVYDYTNVLFTLALGSLMLGQMPDVWSLVGFVVIIFAAFSIRRG